jgi:hypothetical protein
MRHHQFAILHHHSQVGTITLFEFHSFAQSSRDSGHAGA